MLKVFAFWTIVISVQAVTVMEQPSSTCRNLTGVWEIKCPSCNHFEYHRITCHQKSLLLESHAKIDLQFGTKQPSMEYKTVIKFDAKELIESVITFSDSCRITMEDGSEWARVDDIVKVHIIFMNHLDVGYNVNHNYPGTKIKIPGYIVNVLNWYFQVYFPRAARLADELRALRADETFIYTTHPWLVSLFLDCPDWEISGVKLQCPSADQVERFRRAVWMGDVTWHAGPLNQEAESSSPELYSYSLGLSRDLDQQFNIRRTGRTMSQRDVPGMTRAAIPLLLKENIQAVSFGVNAQSAPPDVPSPNVWTFQNQSIITYWHKGGYPLPAGPSPQQPGGLGRRHCQFVPGLDQVLCFAFRVDNRGPPDDVQEIKHAFHLVRYQFPGATVQASTFENFTRLLIPLKGTFPKVDAEIGDTWIQGPASDPVKMIKYRAMNRLRSQCLRQRQCDLKDKRFRDFSRILLKLPEHTYGLATCFDDTDWKWKDFLPKQYLRESFRNNTKDYLGHRKFNDLAVAALKDHPLAPRIQEEWSNLKPYLPDLKNRKLHPTYSPISCKNGLRLAIGEHGGLVQLQTTDGKDWASIDSPLSKIMYRTYDYNDYVNFHHQYLYSKSGAIAQPGYETSGAESKLWAAQQHGIYVPLEGDPCEHGIIVRVIHKDMNSWWKYGAPTEYFLKYQSTDGRSLGIDYQFFNKPTTRMVEALFLTFEPKKQEGHRWFVHKLGHWIDPMTVVSNGSQYVHAVDFGTAYLDSLNHGMMVESPDVATVAVMTSSRGPDVFPVPLAPLTGELSGMAFNFYNNIWGTNFIYWYPYQPEDKHYKARFRISFV